MKLRLRPLRVDDELVGRISVRHRLNDYLTNFGGHIGYGVCTDPTGPRKRPYWID